MPGHQVGGFVVGGRWMLWEGDDKQLDKCLRETESEEHKTNVAGTPSSVSSH